ncbi:M23 family metallopeptidase [filamentous cyanobacterium LEGE 11480]|uniref:M23 family metallopeptidase n=2 Tax=Romeriopsis TaxID=2992131 RepID=A0A928VW49_9CYAN|nr:M23 family metallopeptidase [Romeriopsis navalis LEGE 11480]
MHHFGRRSHRLSWVILATITTLIGHQTSAIATSLCPKPALDRLIRHRVAPRDTLSTIARRYRLIPATIMGFNPNTRSGKVTPGSNLVIPPFNGIRINVPVGTGLKDLATKYKVRADVLFELNGCKPNPRVAFIPGVNWSPTAGTSPISSTVTQPTIATKYPLPQRRPILMGFGWKLRRNNSASAVALHSGIDISATTGSQVFAAASGTVAFVGTKGSYGNLIVINHAQGYQTRYAQLATMGVKRGQRVRRGQKIGTVGQSGRPSSASAHLHFELRSNSKLGWVAEDPAPFLK